MRRILQDILQTPAVLLIGLVHSQDQRQGQEIGEDRPNGGRRQQAGDGVVAALLGAGIARQRQFKAFSAAAK